LLDQVTALPVAFFYKFIGFAVLACTAINSIILLHFIPVLKLWTSVMDCYGLYIVLLIITYVADWNLEVARKLIKYVLLPLQVHHIKLFQCLPASENETSDRNYCLNHTQTK